MNSNSASLEPRNQAAGPAEVGLLHGGAEYFVALIEAIDGAQSSVALETYMFDVHEAFGVASIAVARALVRAAERGVRVRVLVDGVGTGRMPEYWRTEFSRSGVHLAVYAPLGALGILQPSHWRRLHRKLCVVDAGSAHASAFCGGINLLDDYFDPNHGQMSKPRFDFALSLRGERITQAIDHATQSLWNGLRTERSAADRTLHQARQLAPQWFARVNQRLRSSLRRQSAPEGQSKAKVALVLRDNLRNRTAIERAYRKAIAEAKDDIIIANAYFLPGSKLRRALIAATQRGVRVRLLLQGKYEYFMQFHGSRPIYRSLLVHGVEIHQYEASFLHAKVAVIDAEGDKPWTTVGSSNLDPLSLLMAREANVVSRDSALAQALKAKLEQAMSVEGQPMHISTFERLSVWQRGLDQLAYGLMRVGLWILGKRY
jgi:cardiolipin synthase